VSTKSDAQTHLQAAYDLVGPEGLRTLVMELGKVELTNAILHLYNTGWWISRLEAAFEAPQATQLQFLTRLIDKFLPSPKSIEMRNEEADSFTVLYTNPTPGPSSERMGSNEGEGEEA
jgi:ATP phosphoribosyltransferase regulatory subunit HisZ